MQRVLPYIIVLLTHILFAVPAVCQIPDSFQYYLDQAKVSLYQDDFKNAYFYLESAHLLSPASDEPFAYLEKIQFYGSRDKAFEQFMKQGTEALNAGEYRTALFYFMTAHQADPQRSEAVSYINLAKRHADDRVEDVLKKEVPIQSALEALPVSTKVEADPVYVPVYAEVQQAATVPSIKPVSESVAESKLEAEEIMKARKSERIPGNVSASDFPKKTLIGYTGEIRMDKDEVVPEILLSEISVSDTAPQVEIELNKSVVFTGENISRFLAVTENMLEIQRINQRQIMVTSVVRGSSFIHIWDADRRLTINVTGDLPEIKAAAAAEARERRLVEQYEDSFKFSYSNNWNSLYLGNSMKELDRRSLIFTQWLGIHGPTPYGKFDASINFYKFTESTELVGKAIGLTNGRIGPFKDFTIRGYDTSVSFSPLSLPQRSFRGGLVDAYAFNRRVKYTLFQGQDRAVFRTLSPGVTEVRKSYMEGARMVLFPDRPSNLGLNYARGHGVERQNFLKDRVFSIDTHHKYGNWRMFGEVGYDEDQTARIVNNMWDGDNYTLQLNMRDIEKDYFTISSRPTGQGEVGGEIVWDWNPGKNKIYTYLDLYRDRAIPNEEDPNGINLEAGLGYHRPLAEELFWSSNIFYNNTSQLVSPQESFRLNNTLTKDFSILENRTLSLFVTHAYHVSRFSNVPSAEFDRNGIITGFRVGLLRDLSFYANYEYSFVKEVDNGGVNAPTAINMGINYGRNFMKNLSGRVGLSYRNEEDADDRFSFLSGQDSLIGSIGLSYRPNKDVELFMDTRVRNMWKEDPDQTAFNEADVRFGLRSSWDMFFAWNPTAIVEGIVFKDLNGNLIQDEKEPGISGIGINAGKKKTITNNAGRYKVKVSAKKVLVELDVDSVPAGYVFTGKLSEEISIEQGKKYRVNFGLTTRSGIYGVVYFDKNGNKRLDETDELITKAKIILDGERTAYSDQNGSYFFEDIAPGKHKVVFDVNSLPLEYLPLIKLKQNVDVVEGTTYTLHLPLRKK